MSVLPTCVCGRIIPSDPNTCWDISCPHKKPHYEPFQNLFDSAKVSELEARVKELEVLVEELRESRDYYNQLAADYSMMLGSNNE